MCDHGEEGRAHLEEAANNGEPGQRVVVALRLARSGSVEGAEIRDRELLGGRASSILGRTGVIA